MKEDRIEESTEHFVLPPLAMDSDGVVATDATPRRMPRIGRRCLFENRMFSVVDVGADYQLTLRDEETGELRPAELKSIRVLEHDGSDPSADDVAADAMAAKRATLLKSLVDKGRLTSAELKDAARQLSLSTRQVRRLLKRFEGTQESVRGRKPGVLPGSLLLDPRAERVTEEILISYLRRSADISLTQVYPLIERECTEGLGIAAPSRATVDRRLRMLKQRADILPTEVRRALNERRRPVKAHYEAEHPLQIVQIDHTVADVMCVDPLDRLPIGRPTLTLAIDLFTRCVLGVNLGFDPPSSLVTALCLTHAVLPKEDWLIRIGAEGPWPMYGLMGSLHTDNGADFTSQALQKGCNDYGISRIFRPPGTPRFGGAIERLNLTLLMRQQWLPGATYSRTLKRRPKHVERDAALTLEELQCILANEITKYHLETHRTLQTSPSAAWRRAWEGKSPPRLPKNPHQFLMHFLPSTQRVVNREGINLFGLEYWDVDLGLQVRPGHPREIRFDPRDISAIFLREQGGFRRVGLRDDRMPRFSLFEWRELCKRERQSRTLPPNASAVSALLKANTEIVDAGLRDRKRAARQRSWSNQLSTSPAQPAKLPLSSGDNPQVEFTPSVAPYHVWRVQS